ncbi:helix-turn-helix domain-containing protein [Chryseobacterium arachidis]
MFCGKNNLLLYQLGFTNVPYFSRFFKKIKGISPTGIRNQRKG